MTNLSTWTARGLRTRRARLASPAAVEVPAAKQSAVAVFRAALWFGLLTGAAEVGLVLTLKPLHDGTPGLFHMNRHILWMIPLFHGCAFGLAGLLLAILARVRTRFSRRRAATFLAGLSLLSLSLAIRSIHPIACAILSFGVAYRLGPWVEGFVLGPARLVRTTFPWLVGLIAGMVALSAGREAVSERMAMARLPGPRAGDKNVLLIVLDTVGAGHLSLHGYPRATSPNLERIARKAVRFEHARSTAPWTLPSHASMFTGRWPHELSAGFGGPLDSSKTTLAEYLRDRGYATAGLVANSLYCSAETGLNRGFLHYEDHELSPAAILHSAALGQRLLEKASSGVARAFSAPRNPPGAARPTPPSRPYKDAARINRDALDWLARRGDRPFFLFLNYFDAHTPYLLPDGCDRHFGLAPGAKADFATLGDFWMADKRKLSSREVTLARDAYDDCIASLDEQLGRLFAELDRRGLLRHTLVIITADHGEQFGEHQLFGHAGSLYRPEVHVPLVILPPGGLARGRGVAEPVSLRNLPATVVDLIGREGDSPFPGHSLSRHWDPARAGERPPEDPVLSEVQSPATNNPNQGRSPVFRGSMASIVAEGKVYIRNGDGAEELYDLESDPDERHNLAATVAGRDSLSRMRDALERSRRPPAR